MFNSEFFFYQKMFYKEENVIKKKEDTLQFVSVDFVMIDFAFNNILGVISV